MSDRSHEEHDGEARLRRVIGWVVVGGATVWGIFAGTFLAANSLPPDGFIIDLTKQQFGAMILVPMAGLMALCIVLALRFTAGEIRFKGLGFEFEGASGPIVLWVFCFLAIVAGLRVFWIMPS